MTVDENSRTFMNIPPDLYEEGIWRASTLLRQATTPFGILASTTRKVNYNRIWARDGIICGLAGLLTDSGFLIDGLKSTLETLATCQGQQGQIPSNVELTPEGEKIKVSYGGLAGRVDPTAWFIIGICFFTKYTGDKQFTERMQPRIRKCLRVMDSWEINGRGLMYVPQGGDWADEFVLSGYVLSDQLLRLWALRCYSDTFGDNAINQKAQLIESLIKDNYWPSEEKNDSGTLIHPTAYHHYLRNNGSSHFWLAGFNPGGYFSFFDTFSNALAILLDIGDNVRRNRVLEFGHTLSRNFPSKLLPAFWPSVDENNPLWDFLINNVTGEFRNSPGHYQNGGIWPIINAWWGAALVRSGRNESARDILHSIIAINKDALNPENRWGFFEYIDSQSGKPGGTNHMSWNAAAVLILDAALAGKSLFHYNRPSKGRLID